MSLDAATLEKLMAFADGELDPAERTQIEELVRTNPDAANVVRELGVLGECIRVVEAQRPHVAADKIADDVMARIAAAPHGLAPEGSRGNLVSLAARRRRTYGIVAALVAAAAAVVIIARGLGPEETPTANVAPTQGAPTQVAPTPAPSSEPTSTGNVGAVVASAEPARESDTPSNVSVIVVPSEGEATSSVVIWLGEDTTGTGGTLK
jgi:hypothetical protein